MPSPVMTKAAGTLYGPATLAANGTATFTLDASAKFEAQLQLAGTFGTVAATNGLQLQVFPGVGAGPTYDSIAAVTLVIAGTGSTTQQQTIKLPTGLYQFRLTNLDGTNSLTNVAVTWASIDSVQ
jgi:hypothetical protein